jgi:hypothetical protein
LFRTPHLQNMEFDVVVIGGSAGGFAAALAAAEAGANTALVCSAPQLGGQLTTQGVCTPDEQQYIETFGGTQRYMRFRNAVRAYYKGHYRLTPLAQESTAFNPGSCWVSRLSYEPVVGANLLLEMARPAMETGNLSLFLNSTVCGVTHGQDSFHIDSVQIQTPGAGSQTLQAAYFLDATDTGDFLCMCGEEGADWVTGAESFDETGEPDAPAEPRKHWVQPFTFPFAIDWYPQGIATNIIDKPEDYEELKQTQNYHVIHGAITGLFAGRAPWWRYRRILAAENFEDPAIPTDVAMINTAGNDYYGGNVIGTTATGEPVSPELAAAELARARRVSLGYLYWLQTECERTAEDLLAAPGGGADVTTAGKRGYPEFRLRKDLFGTEDGLAPDPYIRESRRIRALQTVKEQDIVVKDFSGNECRGAAARAQFFANSVGVGHYALDIHPNGHGEPNHYVPTRPFQIPLGALIPCRLANVLPACKNLGVTHLTNGAYRLHPIEWNIGESAGLLAAWCVSHSLNPRYVHSSLPAVRAFQHHLVQQGIALHWYIDVPFGHTAFEAVQWLAGFGAEPGNATDLLFHPEQPIAEEHWQAWQNSVGVGPLLPVPSTTRAEAALQLFKQFA